MKQSETEIFIIVKSAMITALLRQKEVWNKRQWLQQFLLHGVCVCKGNFKLLCHAISILLLNISAILPDKSLETMSCLC